LIAASHKQASVIGFLLQIGKLDFITRDNMALRHYSLPSVPDLQLSLTYCSRILESTSMLPDCWQSRRTLEEAILKNAAARGGPVIIKRLLDLHLAPVITDLVAAAGSKNGRTTVV
jgi:hypothetical protein